MTITITGWGWVALAVWWCVVSFVGGLITAWLRDRSVPTPAKLEELRFRSWLKYGRGTYTSERKP